MKIAPIFAINYFVTRMQSFFKNVCIISFCEMIMICTYLQSIISIPVVYYTKSSMKDKVNISFHRNELSTSVLLSPCNLSCKAFGTKITIRRFFYIKNRLLRELYFVFTVKLENFCSVIFVLFVYVRLHCSQM